MSAFTPNVPVETASPRLVVNSRELGFGFFNISLRVRDSAGNESTNPAVGTIFISRGEEAVAVLRSPPIAYVGRPFALYGAESFTKGGGPVIEYVWTLRFDGGSRTFETKTPTVVIGGPSLDPNDPLPRDLPEGKYRVSLAVRDDSGGLSEPDVHPLTIVPEDRVGRRPVAQAQFLVDRRFTDRLVQGTRFELDGSESLPSSPPTGPALRRYLWTWLPVGRLTPSNQAWEQESVDTPLFRPTWRLVAGLHRFRLVVMDARRAESAPTDLVVQVSRP